MTSEQINGIVEQPEPTCPDIDKAIKELDNLISMCRHSEKMDEKELRNVVESVDWELPSIIGIFEELRRANQAIREWGQEWKDKAKELSERQLEGKV